MNKDFKSKLFSLGYFSGDEQEVLKRDSKILAEISTEKWPTILESMKKVIEAKTDRLESDLQQKLIDEGVLTTHQSAAVYRFIISFFKNFWREATKSDNPNDILEDLSTLECIDEDSTPTIRQVLELVRSESEWYKHFRLTKRTERGIIPSLTSIEASAELRGVFEKGVNFGETAKTVALKTKLNTETPVTPIITVGIELNSGTPDTFFFQATPEDVEWIIENLLLAVHKSKLLISSYGSSE